MGNFTFNDENEGNNFLSPKKFHSINRTKSKCSAFKLTREFKNSNLNNFYDNNILNSANNSKKQSDKILNRKSSKKETIKYFEQKIEELKNDNNLFNFITLDDISKQFSKKIKKQLKKRKKFKN